ncbi:MAG: LysM peptidoglycan-binding domain-containing protein [Dysgonamonadaceae bacterium]|nr:LysM peptidoglycan-binding domain-containing protein [Dysgonamonadaceae bacterium]
MPNQRTMIALLSVCIFVVMHSLNTLAAQNTPYASVLLNGQTFYKYNVKTGEGLYAVSRAFSISVDEILKYNPAAKDGLKNGQELLIPASSFLAQQAPIDQNNTFQHTVSRGETVFSIAQMYNTTVTEIYRYNPRAKEKIVEGEKLVIQQRKILSAVKEENYRFHTISAGETLYAVSRTYKLKPEDVIVANPGLSAETFQIGKTIRIPFFESNEMFTVYIAKTEQVKNVLHSVQRKETLYSLAQKYNVSQEDILKANPSITNMKFKTGMTLVIPAKENIEQNNLTQETNAEMLLRQTKAALPVDVLKVGFLMPFLDKSDNHHIRIQEYYEGFLMALLKLKGEGLNIELYSFDTGPANDTKKLESLLGTMEMQELNIVIGGFSEKEIKVMSDFAKAQNIKYVIPLPTKSNEVLNNGQIYQVITPQSYFYTKASNVFLQTFRNANVIIASAAGENDKDDFIAILKNDLQQEKIKYSTVNIGDDFSSAVLPFLAHNKDNVIVPSTGKSEPLRKVIDGLKNVQSTSPEYVTRLFGYPEWQSYNANFKSDYHQFGTYFYSYFFAEEKSPNVQGFNADFEKWYKRAPINVYPKYGMLGYDTALFFLTAIRRYGINFEENINRVNVNTLQFTFHFDRVNNWGGFINTGLYLVYYEPNSEVVTKVNKSR